MFPFGCGHTNLFLNIGLRSSLRFDSILLRRAAADAYLQTRDASSLAKLIWSMLRQPETPGSEHDPKDQAAELAGPVLREVFLRAPK